MTKSAWLQMYNENQQKSKLQEAEKLKIDFKSTGCVAVSLAP